MDPLQALGQYVWVLDYLDDIASDLSVFHRIDDPGAMPSVDYLKKAKRLFAYKGVMRARLEHEQEEERRLEEATTPQQYRGDTQTEVPLDALLSQVGGEHVKEGMTDG